MGDSITHGRVSFNYVDLLQNRPAFQNVIVVNAGINSELAYNVRQRLGDVIRIRPDVITILIGTNDANAALSQANTKRAIKNMGLPQTPTLDFYRENLTAVCLALKEKTGAQIALLSLPPIGEDLDHPAAKQAATYSRVIRETAGKLDLAYLPLHETMTAYIRAHPGRPKAYTDYWQLTPNLGYIQHFILGRSFDEISRGNGFVLLTDFLHLNHIGANMTADLIEGFAQKALTGD